MRIDSYEDVLDIRDLIDGLANEDITFVEHSAITALLKELRGNGGDHKHEGDWYPVTLIRDTYFVTYAQELADDIGAVNSNAGWPTYCIDWDRAAQDLKLDYSDVEYDGVTYWYRCS